MIKTEFRFATENDAALILNFINPIIDLVVGTILYIVFIVGSLLILRKVQNP